MKKFYLLISIIYFSFSLCGDGEKVDSDVAELFERYSKMLNESSFSEDPIISTI